MQTTNLKLQVLDCYSQDFINLMSGLDSQLMPFTTAVLVAGTVTVANTAIKSTSVIEYQRSTAGGTLGELSYAITAGTSFTFTSSSATDTSTIQYRIIY